MKELPQATPQDQALAREVASAYCDRLSLGETYQAPLEAAITSALAAQRAAIANGTRGLRRRFRGQTWLLVGLARWINRGLYG